MTPWKFLRANLIAKISLCSWIVLFEIQKFEFMNYDVLEDKDPLDLGGRFVLYQTTTRLFNGSSELTSCNNWWTYLLMLYYYLLSNTWAICEWLVRSWYMLVRVVRLRSLMGGDGGDRVGARWRVIHMIQVGVRVMGHPAAGGKSVVWIIRGDHSASRA